MANTQLSDATHIMAYIALHTDDQLKSEHIASSLNTDPTMVRRMMSKLRKSGLLTSVRGVARPTLACSPNDITLKDIYVAVVAKRNFLNVDHNTSETCPVGSVIPRVMEKYYCDIQNSAEARMSRVTLQDIIDDISAVQQQA